jgi:hypothetical protein
MLMWSLSVDRYLAANRSSAIGLNVKTFTFVIERINSQNSINWYICFLELGSSWNLGKSCWPVWLMNQIARIQCKFAKFLRKLQNSFRFCNFWSFRVIQKFNPRANTNYIWKRNSNLRLTTSQMILCSKNSMWLSQRLVILFLSGISCQ